ncbi:alpha-hydroxy acid oxidase [uncultured Alsobacter sp.]|uniref:alpha-hydroxy acid oxidase n=1 Tax=uncultured Alsobacter sp. TaxID=1748258 RepID=UPI0025FCB335|nr:alpha-hydroxy acid oxidase [uncultured Alsobacter sp.]
MIQPKLDRIPAGIGSLADFEALAHDRLDPGAFAYLMGGAGDGITRDRNRQSLDGLELVPRVLRSLAGGSTACTLFGSHLPHPVLMAPVGFLTVLHEAGEAGAAQAADATDTPMVLSTLSSTPLEEVAAAAPGPKWFQLYVQADRGLTRALVQRAEAAGYRAIVITADAPISGVRDAERRAGFRLPPTVTAANLPGGRALVAGQADRVEDPLGDILREAPTWEDVRSVCAMTRLPVLVKGILAPGDAETAIQSGAAGVVVSNHGGRTLDTAIPSIRALPRVAEAVAGRVPVLMDGGILRGTDVLKALALGATAVLVGRAWATAFAAAGPLGAAWALKVLVEEFAVAMALTGCRTLADIRPDLLETPRP